MPKEQMTLPGFGNLPFVESNSLADNELKDPRFPLIARVTEIYKGELLMAEGLTYFDDGEDRFLFALHVREDMERMLLAKTTEPGEDFSFTQENALIVEAFYSSVDDDPYKDRPYKVSYYILDFSKFNSVDDDNHWSEFFWSDELDKKN